MRGLHQTFIKADGLWLKADQIIAIKKETGPLSITVYLTSGAEFTLTNAEQIQLLKTQWEIYIKKSGIELLSPL